MGAHHSASKEERSKLLRHSRIFDDVLGVADCMKLFVKTSVGKTIDVYCAPLDAIWKVSAVAQCRVHARSDRQELIHEGSTRTLTFYDVQREFGRDRFHGLEAPGR